MKIKTVIILLCVVFLFSCSQTNKNSQQANTKSDSIIKRDNIATNDSVGDKLKGKPIDKSTVVHFDPVKIDILIENIHISYIVQDNEGIVSSLSYNNKSKPEITYFADRSVFINLKRGSKNILSNREIKKTDFTSIIPKNEIGKYQIGYFGIKSIENNGVTFSLNICKPDTDICYPLELFISNQGVFTFKVIDEGKMED